MFIKITVKPKNENVEAVLTKVVNLNKIVEISDFGGSGCEIVLDNGVKYIIVESFTDIVNVIDSLGL